LKVLPSTPSVGMLQLYEPSFGVLATTVSLVEPLFHTILTLLTEPFLMVFGVLQNLDGVISVKAARIDPLHAGPAAESHDFH